ncbi:hypothetical protein DB88DRAFT_475708 [Papiliotrema laurentii]|uniref:Uncharacterized protein n=1 Tax=Papiliotrema laurentii TaxID=5418 RepID=A0AAD9FMX9_PAPLA|nr:hypothetical protein DB88DRAFT_475708 [Papiliotrema laurentii]
MKRWAVATMIYIHIVYSAFQMSWSIVLKTSSTEIQPDSTRANVSAIAECINWIVKIIITSQSHRFSLSRLVGRELYTVPSVKLRGCCWPMPETRDLSIQGRDVAWEEKSLQVSHSFREAQLATCRLVAQHHTACVIVTELSLQYKTAHS